LWKRGTLFYNPGHIAAILPRRFKILCNFAQPMQLRTRAVLLLISLAGMASAQHQNNAIPYFTSGKGLGIISPDSLFFLNIRFRIQNRLGLQSFSESDLDIKQVEARVRRLRLRLDGYVYSPRLTYVLQLSFSRADMDFDDTGFPNVVRDAFVLYTVSPHFAIGIGQTKLPGNRQRVVSSGDLQLPDRSIVNARFNIDRDFGVQLYYNNTLGGMPYLLRGAISSGEGRNVNTSDRGLAYTGRVEVFPLGLFTSNGDYFEGDLIREPRPKISLAAGYSANYNTLRTGGQLGKPLFAPRDMYTFMTDFLFKQKGWALAVEYLQRQTNQAITTDTLGNRRYVYSGHGLNVQLSHMFATNYELVGRYSVVRPDFEIQNLEPRTRQYTVGINHYLRGHRVKLQTDLTFEENVWLQNALLPTRNWQLRFQVEVGI